MGKQLCRLSSGKGDVSGGTTMQRLAARSKQDGWKQKTPGAMGLARRRLVSERSRWSMDVHGL